MTMKFPIEMMTSLSSAPRFSVVIWDESGFYLDTRNEYNYKNIVDGLKSTKDKIDNFLNANQDIIAEIPQIKTYISTVEPTLILHTDNFEAINERLRTFNTTLNNYAGKISPIERSISDIFNDLKNLRLSYTEVNSVYNSMDSRLKVLEASGGLSSRIQQVEQQQLDSTRRVTYLEESIPNMTLDLQSATLRIQNLESKISFLESSIEVIQNQLG